MTQNPTHLQLNQMVNNLVGNKPIRLTIEREAWFKAGYRQLDLILDEAKELRDGVNADDLQEIRDGVGDVIVTLDGLIHRLGLPEPDFELLTHRHLARLDRSAPSLVEEIFEHLELMVNTMREVESEEDLKKTVLKVALFGAAISIYDCCYAIARLYGFDLHADQVAIYESNMSKFDTDKAVALTGIEKYARLGVVVSIHPNVVEVDGEQVTYYVLKSDHDQIGSDNKSYPAGKFLKSVNFKDPVFAPL